MFTEDKISIYITIWKSFQRALTFITSRINSGELLLLSLHEKCGDGDIIDIDTLQGSIST